jgi:hypothetical protein
MRLAGMRPLPESACTCEHWAALQHLASEVCWPDAWRLPEQAQEIEDSNARLMARAQSVEHKHQAMAQQVGALFSSIRSPKTPARKPLGLIKKKKHPLRPGNGS